MNVVEKVWGSETVIVNREYCGKILNLKKGYRCSIHYHKKKDETFYILSGKVLFERKGDFGATDKEHIMLPGYTVHIAPFISHRFTGLVDSTIIEFSTHDEDSDSYRLTKSERVKDD